MTYLFAADVAGAEDVLHLVGHQELLEGVGDARGSLWDVQVADDQSELLRRGMIRVNFASNMTYLTKLIYCHVFQFN